MVFEVPIPLYLRLSDGLRGVSRFQLQNQTLSNGKVVFHGAGGRKRLESILNYVNHGTSPPGVLLDPYVVKVGEVSVEDLQRVIEGLTGPDGDGFYHGRCPACAAGLHGRRDRGKDHFYCNPTQGRIGCFAGCKKKEVMVYFEQTNVSSEETVQTTIPTQTLSVSVQNAQVVSTERPEITNDKLQTPAKIIEQNVDFLVVQKYKKNGEPGTSHKLEIEELKTFAQSLASFKRGEVITIQEHYDVLGWDLVKDQGTRVITRRYHPYIAALYALGEIDVYKDGSIRRN